MEKYQINEAENCQSDSTVSGSMQESMEKALQLAMQQEGLHVPHKVVRPDIHIFRMLLKAALLCVPAAVLTWASRFLPAAEGHTAAVGICAAALTLVFCLKRFIVSLILIYQRYAPERIRAACLFEPSCSNYMLMAIDKYGVLKGVAKGIGRLMRCRYPNSGIDYP